MKSSKIHSSTDVGVVTLFVKSLRNMTTFYSSTVGLDILESNENFSILGHGENAILKLQVRDDLHFPHYGEAGLYHTAIVFEKRSHLAKALKNVFEKSPHSYEGSGDHYVSQAFYFHDPEGNGLELYYDRPREEWRWEDGKIMMGVEYINADEFISEHIAHEEASKAKTGHIHLKVGDLETAKKFYVDILGFDITAEMPTALFISAGGYHHHFGLNTWESLGAKERTESLGLSSFEILVPDDSELNQVQKRLEENKISFDRNKSFITTKDPWNNIVVIKVS